MTVYTIYSGTNDGHISSGPSTTYSVVRAGTNLSATTSGTALVTGQNFAGRTNYIAFEGFVSFDTSSVSGTITSASLTLTPSSVYGPSYYILAKIYDWGTTVTTADWVAGASLSSYTDYGSVNITSTSTSARTFSDVNGGFGPQINTSGETRILLVSQDQQTGSAPTGVEYVQWYSAEQSGTTNDPVLSVVTSTAWSGSALLGNIGVLTADSLVYSPQYGSAVFGGSVSLVSVFDYYTYASATALLEGNGVFISSEDIDVQSGEVLSGYGSFDFNLIQFHADYARLRGGAFVAASSFVVEVDWPTFSGMGTLAVSANTASYLDNVVIQCSGSGLLSKAILWQAAVSKWWKVTGAVDVSAKLVVAVGQTLSNISTLHFGLYRPDEFMNLVPTFNVYSGTIQESGNSRIVIGRVFHDEPHSPIAVLDFYENEPDIIETVCTNHENAHIDVRLEGYSVVGRFSGGYGSSEYIGISYPLILAKKESAVFLTISDDVLNAVKKLDESAAVASEVDKVLQEKVVAAQEQITVLNNTVTLLQAQLDHVLQLVKLYPYGEAVFNVSTQLVAAADVV